MKSDELWLCHRKVFFDNENVQCTLYYTVMRYHINDIFSFKVHLGFEVALNSLENYFDCFKLS